MVSLCPDAVHFVNRAISAGWRAAWIVTPADAFALTPTLSQRERGLMDRQGAGYSPSSVIDLSRISTPRSSSS